MGKVNRFVMTDGSGVENKSKKRMMTLVSLTLFFPLGDMSYINQKEARFCHEYIFPENSHSGSVEWSRPDLAGLVYTQSRMRQRVLRWGPLRSPCWLSASLLEPMAGTLPTTVSSTPKTVPVVERIDHNVAQGPVISPIPDFHVLYGL